MTPTTHATSTANEALLQANETLLHAITLLQDAVKKINDDLTLVKSTIQNVQENTLLLHQKTTDIEEKLESIETNCTEKVDKLSLQTDTIAVELDQLQQKTQSITRELENIPLSMTPSPTLLQSINTNIDTKLRSLPVLVKNEIQAASISQVLPKTKKLSGFHQQESKEFHVSKLLKLLDTHTITGEALQDLEIFYDTIILHLSTVTLQSHLYLLIETSTLPFDFMNTYVLPRRTQLCLLQIYIKQT